VLCAFLCEPILNVTAKQIAIFKARDSTLISEAALLWQVALAEAQMATMAHCNPLL